MNTTGKNIALFAAMVAIIGDTWPFIKEGQHKSSLTLKDIDGKPKELPIPKGCKEYFFNSLGDFLNYNDGVYTFKCVAISDKSAIKKFEKWVSKQGAV